MSTISLCTNLPVPRRADRGDGTVPAGPEVLVLAAAPSRGEPALPRLVTSQEAEEALCAATGSAAIDMAALEEILPSLGFGARLDSVVRVPVSAVRPRGSGTQVADSLKTVLVVGLGSTWHQATSASGPCADLPADDSSALGEDQPGLLRRAAGRATRALSGARWAALALPTPSSTWLRCVCEGALLGACSWSGSSHGSSHRVQQGCLERISVLTPLAATDEGQEAVEDARVLSQATALARDLVNEPPNRLTPDDLALRAAHLAQEASLGIRTWQKDMLEKDGFGGLLAVGGGSVHPPVLVRLRWEPPAARAHVALVGKGVTFDSGGLSLKPPTSMPTMKADMAGAAAVLAAVLAASQRALPVRVTGWLALAENMPGPTALRPGDVITTADGTTVEVTNTDAEGRLVMADALAAAVAEEPDVVLDVATLTGAQVIALGNHVAGVMGTPCVREEVVTAARCAGEALWPMPLPAALRSSLESPVADLRNAKVGNRAGGMLVAGLFLREFVSSTPWAHLDIAGPAFNDSAPWGLTPEGGTGAGVATLVELLRRRGQRETAGSHGGSGRPQRVRGDGRPSARERK